MRTKSEKVIVKRNSFEHCDKICQIMSHVGNFLLRFHPRLYLRNESSLRCNFSFLSSWHS